MVQGLHTTLDGARGPPWARGEARRARLVLIGRRLREPDLRAGFAACLAAPPPPPPAAAAAARGEGGKGR